MSRCNVGVFDSPYLAAVAAGDAFIEANVTIHADAKKLHAETATLKNFRSVSLCLKIRPACLSVNAKECPIAT